MSNNITTMSTLKKELGKASLISIGIYAALMITTYIVGVKIVFNLEMIFSIIASITGVAYVIAIKNPLNYIGFYLGVVMSVFLAMQYTLMKSYDLTLLYLLIFIPMQIKSTLEWKQGFRKYSKDPHKATDFKPKFLTKRTMLIVLLVFAAITLADILFLKHIMHSTLTIYEITSSAIMLSASAVSNYLMIYKRIDAWIYWVIFSLAGIIFAVQINNHFNLILFIVFLIINSYTGIIWYKNRQR